MVEEISFLGAFLGSRFHGDPFGYRKARLLCDCLATLVEGLKDQQRKFRVALPRTGVLSCPSQCDDNDNSSLRDRLAPEAFAP